MIKLRIFWQYTEGIQVCEKTNLNPMA